MENSTSSNGADNDSGLSVGVAEALAAFSNARQHAENADRIFRSIEDEQHAMSANWGGSSQATYMNAAMGYNDEASEITRGLFNFISVSEDGIRSINSDDENV